jgi:hypothetical protein
LFVISKGSAFAVASLTNPENVISTEGGKAAAVERSLYFVVVLVFAVDYSRRLGSTVGPATSLPIENGGLEAASTIRASYATPRKTSTPSIPPLPPL